jgi:hypothetical protein
MACQVLYHYCSLKAFLGIVQSREIRLTNIFSMNDSAEHYWLRRVARRLARQTGENKNLRSLASKLFPKDEATELYCCCFSEMDDSLAQWRAYADDGRGVAIGFDRGFLGSLYKKYRGLFLRTVVYDPKKQEEIVEEIITQTRNDHDPPPAGLPGELTEDLPATVAKVSLWLYAAWCKNPAFHEERESRLVYNPKVDQSTAIGQRRYRSTRGKIVPYYALPLTADDGVTVIREIMFGPKNAHKHNEAVARRLLSDKGYYASRISFRVSEATYT